MRRTTMIVAALALCLSLPFTGPTGAGAQAADDTITFSGGGWGHGVGMSQFGARALAVHGCDGGPCSAAQILGHYYSGISIGTIGDAANPNLGDIMVNLQRGVTHAELRNRGAGVLGVFLTDGTLVGTMNPDPSTNPGDSLVLDWTGGGCQASLPSGAVATDCNLVIKAYNDGVASDLGVDANGAHCKNTDSTVNECRDRVDVVNLAGMWVHGRIEIRPDPDGDGGFHVINTLPMEEYLYGLAEMPSSWPASALQAQAIAGRSYAYARMRANPQPGSGLRADFCYCHIVSTPADQYVTGWDKENEGTAGVNWVAAVDATAGQMIAAGGAAQPAYYSSSMFVRTENVEDSFGGQAASYLVSVPDPWSADSAANNPYASWTSSFAESDVATRVGLGSVRTVVEAGARASGFAEEFVFVGAAGANSAAATAAAEIATVPADIAATGATPGTGQAATVPRLAAAESCAPYVAAGEVCVIMSASEVKTAFGLRSFQIGQAGPAFAGPFSDDDGNIHEANIALIAAAGVTAGCDATGALFCPGEPVPRWQMAIFLVRATGLALATGPSRFTDDDGQTYEPFLETLAIAGITAGCTATQFCPNQEVTRSEMAVFLYRAFALADGGVDYFGDDAGSPYEAYHNALRHAGVSAGCDAAGTQYCGGANVRRDEMATFLARAMGLA